MFLVVRFLKYVSLFSENRLKLWYYEGCDFRETTEKVLEKVGLCCYSFYSRVYFLRINFTKNLSHVHDSLTHLESEHVEDKVSTLSLEQTS